MCEPKTTPKSSKIDIIAILISALALIVSIATAKMQSDSTKDLEKIAHTVAVCEQYYLSEAIVDIAKNVYVESRGPYKDDNRLHPSSGSNYNISNDPTRIGVTLQQQIVTLANFLNTVAIGVENNLYDETIIRECYKDYFGCAVEKFVGDEKAVEEKTKFVKEKEVKYLVSVHNRWKSFGNKCTP